MKDNQENILSRSCNVCNSDKSDNIIDLGYHPLADSFFKIEDRAPETWYPLYVKLCKNCGHAYTGHIIDERARYQRVPYSYDSSNSMVSIKHFELLAEFVKDTFNLKKESKIVDIGSNVGTLLISMRDLGFKELIGVEPAENIAAISIKSGIKTINSFFNKTVADEILKDSACDVIISSNTLNHIDDLKILMKNLSIIIKPNGIFVVEVPYFKTLFDSIAFDTIYHEHVNYFSVKSLKKLFNEFGFSITYVSEIDYMGGSLRVVAKKNTQESSNVKLMIEKEESSGLFNSKSYVNFMSAVKALRGNLLNFLYKAKMDNKKVVGIGAATKGNTLLNYCSINSELMDSIADTSDLKIGKVSPGSRIQIINEKNIDKKYCYGVILPWNIGDFLIDKLKYLNLEFYVPRTIERVKYEKNKPKAKL